MTMTTHMAILRPVPLMELFQYGRDLLGADDSVTWRDQESYRGNGIRWIANDIDQGLPGIWDIEYRPDGPLQAEAHECADDDCDHYDQGIDSGPAKALEASIDTTYGYSAPNGAGCGDLHAWFVTEIASWCTERGAEVLWVAHEVTSGWESVSRIDLLGEVDAGRPGSVVPRSRGVDGHEAFGALVQALVRGTP